MAGNKLGAHKKAYYFIIIIAYYYYSAAATRLVADPQAEVGRFSESADRADPGRERDYSRDQKR